MLKFLTNPKIRLIPLVSKPAALLMVVGLGACAGDPSLGDNIRAQGVELAAIGDQWSEGNDLIDLGKEQMEEGGSMVEEGENLIDEGSDNLSSGREMKASAEADYRQRTGKQLPVN